MVRTITPVSHGYPDVTGKDGYMTACSLHLAWDPALAGYDFGPGHPLAPVRVELEPDVVLLLCA